MSWDATNGDLTWIEAASGDWGRLYVVRSALDTFGVMTVFPRGNLNKHEGKNFLPEEMNAAAVKP